LESAVSATARRPHSSRNRESLDGRHPRKVVMPPESYGFCRIRTCRVIGDLAAGLCQAHWDKGLDTPRKYDARKHRARKKRDDDVQ